MKFYLFTLIILLTLMLSISAKAQNDIEDLLKKTAEYEEQNKVDEAIGEITKAIAIEPQNVDLYLRRADLYFALNQYRSVAADVNKAFSLSQDDKRVVLTGARLLRNIKQCAESLNLLDTFIVKNPANDEVIFSRAHSNMCLGDWLSAYQDTLKAIELNPRKNLYLTTRAGILAGLGDSQNAAEQFERMIKMLEAKLSKAAEDGQRQAVKRDLSEVYRVRANVNHTKGDEIAEFADLAKFIEYSTNEFSYRMRAKVYQNHRMYQEAIADYNQAIKISPDQTIFFLERGDVYAESGKYDEALKDYEQSLKLDASLKEIVEQRVNWVKSKMK